MGSGVSGSISSSATPIPRPNPTPELTEELVENNEKTEEVRARCPGVQGCDAGAGESSERKPEESDAERVCDARLEGPGRATALLPTDCELSDDVMFMLPPPTTWRFNRLARRWCSVRACSGVVVIPGRGTTETVPSNCAYE